MSKIDILANRYQGRERRAVEPRFNPKEARIELIGTEKELSDLTPRFLRRQFNALFDWQPEFIEINHKRTSFQPAAVLIPIIQRENGLTVLFTERSLWVSDHAGQISFPGGRWELSDESLIMTALRETKEEIGLESKYIEVIGSLPLHTTVSGYEVTPVVGLVSPPFELHLDDREVKGVFEVPLSFLMNGAHHQKRVVTLEDEVRRFFSIEYQSFFIWGSTANMLRNLFHFLRVNE
jgi:8-oxo-dGTP pyrophosphatase MutT (NUDIX family)